MSKTPETEALHLLRDLRRQWEREIRADERAKWKEKLAAYYQKGLRDGRAEKARHADAAGAEAYERGRQDGRADGTEERKNLLAGLEDKRLQFAAETLRRSEAIATIAQMTDALRRCRTHLAHPAPDGAFALARLLDTILSNCPPLMVLSPPRSDIPPEQVQAIRERFDALKGKGSFHDAIVLDEQAIKQRAAEFIDRLDASLAADVLDGAMSDAEVVAELRAAGADPERIGREGEALVRELAEKLPVDDPRRALVLEPEQPLPATVLSVQALDGPSGAVLVPCEEHAHLAVDPGFLGIPVGSTIEVDLDAAARSGAFEAAVDQVRPEPVVVRDEEEPPGE